MDIATKAGKNAQTIQVPRSLNRQHPLDQPLWHSDQPRAL
jgi:hypothetical protein